MIRKSYIPYLSVFLFFVYEIKDTKITYPFPLSHI